MSEAPQREKTKVRSPLEWLAGLAALTVGGVLLWAVENPQPGSSPPRGSVPAAAPTKPATPPPQQQPLQTRLTLVC
jgi:hypothetical protein